MWYLIGFIAFVLLLGFWPTVILLGIGVSGLMTWTEWDKVKLKYLEWQWRRAGGEWDDRPPALVAIHKAQSEADSFGARLDAGLRDGTVVYEPTLDEQQPGVTEPKPSKLAGAAAFASGVVIGSHIVAAHDHKKEAKRLARNIAYHTNMMRQEKGILKDYHQDEIVKLQAKLAALQTR